MFNNNRNEIFLSLGKVVTSKPAHDKTSDDFWEVKFHFLRFD